MQSKIHKRIGALFLSLALCLGLLPTAALAANAAAVEDIWNGTSDTEWYNDSEAEFTLTTAEELAGLAKLVNKGNTFENKTVKLGGNINLSDHEWTSIGIEGQGWKGTFDGQNYQISNLTTSKEGSESGHGLFYYISGGEVENLHVLDANIVSSGTYLYMGILADWTNGSVTIRNCHTSGTIHNKTGNKLLGGVIGSAKAGAQIIGCSSDAEIISEYYDDGDEYSDCDTVGGIVGQWENATDAALISDCWFGGSISCGFNDSGVGGILGANFDFYESQPGVDIQNCLVATRDIRCVEPGNITWIGAVVNGQVTNCLWPDSPPSDVVLDPDIYPDYNGNYLAVVKMVVDWEAETASPDPTFDQTACGQAVAEFDAAEVLTTLQSNAAENIHWVAGKEHPVFQHQVAIDAINETISRIMQREDWTVKEEDANTDEAIEAILEQRLSEMQLDMSCTVTIDSVTPASNGIDGSFDFTVELSKNGVSRFVEITSCIIDATPLPQNAPSIAPELASRSTSSISLKAVTEVNENGAAMEYGISTDGAVWTWRDSPEFTGLKSGTTYSFALRYQRIGVYDVSPIGPTANFSTESTGGNSDPTYSITLPDNTPGGTVKASHRYAERGNTITLTLIPDDGYELNTLTATDSKGNEIDLTHKSDGKYTFKMPAGRVEIEASFRKIKPEPLPFTDIAENAWYADAVRYVYQHGLMTGTGGSTFNPDGTTTRAQLVTILWRQAGSPVVNYLIDFSDIPADAYYTEAVRWAASEGITGGYGNGKFGSDDPITREQLAAILYRYAQKMGYDVTGRADLTGYADLQQVSGYALEAMRWAVDNGIITGTTSTTISPKDTATRAQAAAILMRFAENL